MRGNGLSDIDLVEKVLSGDITYFDMIVSKYKDLVFSVARSVVSDCFLAEDIAQETFIDCYLGLSGLKDTEKLGSWLYGIAKRKALHSISKRKSFSDIDEYSETLSDFPQSPEDEFIRKETEAAIRNALSNLSEKNRKIAEMFYLREMKISRISEELKIPVGTVKSRLYEARNKLKGELHYMNTRSNTLPGDFEAKVNKAIQNLRYYYSVNGESPEGYEKIADNVTKLAEGITDEKSKNKALSDILYYTSWYDKSNELRSKAMKSAEKCENADVICAYLIDELIEIGNDYSRWIEFADTKAIPRMEELDSTSNKGIILFWKARAYHGMREYDKAYETFCEAVRLIDSIDNYHACALCGKKSMELLRENADSQEDICVTSETLLKDGGKLIFASQPGFGGSSIPYHLLKYDHFDYYLSQAGRMMFDSSMKEGEKHKASSGTLEIVSYAEAVSTSVGKFEGCMHVRSVVINDYTADSYYAPNVGLVKAIFSDDTLTQSYELSDYVIRGGSGYMPFAVGNRWTYVNPNLPDYVYSKYENEIDWTDGTSAHLSTVCVESFKKNYLTECTLDEGGRCN